MAIQIVMPKLGLTMEKGFVLKWYKGEGDSVEKGETLLEVETDKIANEVESPASGTVIKILVEEGAEVEVKTLLAVIGEEGEDISELIAETAQSADIPSSKTAHPVSGEAFTKAAPTSSRLRATPRARRLMEMHGIELSAFDDFGKSRIVEEDVQGLLKEREGKKAGDAVSAAGAGALSGRLVPMTRSRQVLAARMVESFRDIPQFSLRFKAEMDHTLGLFPDGSTEAGLKITVTDLILRAVAIALSRQPAVQSQARKGDFFEPGSVNIGLAIAVEDDLIVPVMRDADKKRIGEISREASMLIEKAKNKQLAPDDLAAGTFTVSNLGMFGVTSFTPILVPGQGSILGVGSLQEVPVVRKGTIGAARVVELTLVCDHRAVNGTAGAAFCQELKKVLETEEATSW